MIQRSTLMRTALAGAVLALAAGCGSMSMPGKAASGTGASSTDTYEATLNGTQEVPPNTSAGTGKAEVQVDPRTYKISWRVTHSGLSGPATAAHIHGPAAPTGNAGVVVPFTGNVNARRSRARPRSRRPSTPTWRPGCTTSTCTRRARRRARSAAS